MNVVERSNFVDEEGNITLMNRINATFEYGFSWYGRMQSQEVVTQRLGRVFSDDHVMLRNVSVPGIDEGEPYMILISPQGVRLIMTYPIRGVYRAKETDWFRFNGRSRRFVRTKPNLQTVALNFQDKVSQLLEAQGYKVTATESVLIFTHPRTLIDSARPFTRVVSADAIEYFAANLEQLPPILNSQQVHTLVDAILYPHYPEPQPAEEFIEEPEIPVVEDEEEYEPAFFPESLDAFDDDVEFVEAVDQFFDVEDDFAMSIETEDVEPTTGVGISRRQWLILGCLALLEILVLIVFAIVVLRNMGQL
ncbi:MAG: hypothetical protein GTO18_15820 [Anaerolineales bacterium]|nr:hypothetical protein [Anaerolineales bacterium]